MRPVFNLVAFGVCLATSLPAQGVTTPDPDGRRLPLGADSLAIFVIQGRDTTRTGIVEERLSIVRDGGREVLQRVYRSTDQILGSRSDTLTDALPGLLPIRHRSHTDRGIEFIDFSTNRARGWLRLANGDSVSVESPSANAFNASSFDLVLRASSLKTGWQATITAFVATARASIPLTARVVGEDSVDGERCWRVQADFGGTPVTFWIGQQSRRLRQQLMVLRPDMQILFRAVAPSA